VPHLGSILVQSGIHTLQILAQAIQAIHALLKGLPTLAPGLRILGQNSGERSDK
jgi:hypothetical protein